MAITPIDRVSQIYKQNAQALKGSTGDRTAFEAIYNAAKSVVSDTTSLQNASRQITEDFIVGKTDNIHEVMIAAEKANVALQFTVELRNKAIEAYKEIMRLQI